MFTNPNNISIDLRAIKFNQASIVLVSSFAILGKLPILLLILAIILFAGTLNPGFALFKRFFSEGIKSWLKLPQSETLDDPRAHNVAQGMVASTTLLAFLSYLSGVPVLGLALLIMNIGLCLLSITTSFCVGCQLYFHYKRLRWRLGR